MEPPPLPATLGEFRIDGVLGRGGSGIVYDAMWGPRHVALQVMTPGLIGTGKETAQFLTGARRLQQVGHPSVVKVLSVGQLPDERLDGETLAHVIAPGALPLTYALELFSELAAAVATLHDQGLVHRDLGFGIAKDLSAPPSTTTQEGNVRGTPAYMAPERFFGDPPTSTSSPSCDQLADPAARLSLRALETVPEAVDVEIRRALSTRAQNRPAAAHALLAAVRAAVSGAAAPADPAVTARLRPGVSPPAPDAPSPASPPSALAATEQQTPLAWTPTLAAQKSPRRRWPWGAAALAVAAAGGFALWPRSHHAVVPVASPSPVPVPIPPPPRTADDLDPEVVHALVRHGAGPPAHARDIVARLTIVHLRGDLTGLMLGMISSGLSL